MSEPTKDDLLEFMKKHGPESVDSITDKDSAIKHFRTSSKLYKQQRDQYKTERDTLINDIAVLKANISRLEREKEEFHRKLMAQLEVNTELRMSSKDKHAILSEFSQHIGNKPSSSSYKRFRAKLDSIGIKEGE